MWLGTLTASVSVPSGVWFASKVQTRVRHLCLVWKSPRSTVGTLCVFGHSLTSSGQGLLVRCAYILVLTALAFQGVYGLVWFSGLGFGRSMRFVALLLGFCVRRRPHTLLQFARRAGCPDSSVLIPDIIPSWY